MTTKRFCDQSFIRKHYALPWIRDDVLVRLSNRTSLLARAKVIQALAMAVSLQAMADSAPRSIIWSVLKPMGDWQIAQIVDLGPA